MLGAVGFAAAVAVTATWALGGLPGSGGSATTTFRSDEGWTITYPSAFHRRTFWVGFGGVVIVSDRGVSIGNFWPLPAAHLWATSPDPLSGSATQLIGVPPQGVLFQLYSSGRGPGGAAHFPLTLHDLLPYGVDPFHFRQAGPGEIDFDINGKTFSAVAIVGPVASRADLDALSRLISSVRFSPRP